MGVFRLNLFFPLIFLMWVGGSASAGHPPPVPLSKNLPPCLLDYGLSKRHPPQGLYVLGLPSHSLDRGMSTRGPGTILSL